MIAETVIGAVTLIVLGSLWASKRIVESAFEKTAGPKVWIEPYVYPSRGIQCPKCGVAETARYPEWGPKAPKACRDMHCPAFPREHLHVSCGYCKAMWFRAPKKG